MIILKLIIFYLFIGCFVNLFVYFAEHSALKQLILRQIDENKIKEAEETGLRIFQLSFEFDLMAFILGSVAWPFVLYLVLSK